MRLINVRTLELRTFNTLPPLYACLSHRWSGIEATYESFVNGSEHSGAGTNKIKSFCQLLGSFELYENSKISPVQWCWVDTCCIDKRSSAELSEAINSMAKWYENAEFCVAYLNDVPSSISKDDTELHTRRSGWFMRAWTLQELLFPAHVVFVSRDWQVIPDFDTQSANACRMISEITTIPAPCLGNLQAVFRCTVALRMRWAANRQATRPEDRAYSLLGIFQINMPLLYGEGDKAFLRLQEQIINNYDDETILAWTRPGMVEPTPVLAPSPWYFRHSWMLSPVYLQARPPFRITNRGLELETEAVTMTVSGHNTAIIQLNCCQAKKDSNRVCLLALREFAEQRWCRVYAGLEADDVWGHLLSLGPTNIRKVASAKYYISTSSDNFELALPFAAGEVPQSQSFITLDKMYMSVVAADPRCLPTKMIGKRQRNTSSNVSHYFVQSRPDSTKTIGNKQRGVVDHDITVGPSSDVIPGPDEPCLAPTMNIQYDMNPSHASKPSRPFDHHASNVTHYFMQAPPELMETAPIGGRQQNIVDHNVTVAPSSNVTIAELE